MGGRAPFLLPLGAMAFFPGMWLYGAYAYPSNHSHSYRNDTSKKNESAPVTCLCQKYSVCGCDDNNNKTYTKSLFKDTDRRGLPHNSSTVRVADVNGTKGIYINGTLPNGTTAADPSKSNVSGKLLKLSGYWVMASITVAAVTLL